MTHSRSVQIKDAYLMGSWGAWGGLLKSVSQFFLSKASRPGACAPEPRASEASLHPFSPVEQLRLSASPPLLFSPTFGPPPWLLLLVSSLVLGLSPLRVGGWSRPRSFCRFPWTLS